MTDIIAIREIDDPRDAVHRAVQAITTGKAVGLPGDDGYQIVIAANQRDIMERVRIDGEDELFSLMLRDSEEIEDYVAPLSGVARRLVTRCCPGPILLELPAPTTPSLLSALPESVQQAVRVENFVRVGVPQSPILREIHPLLPVPALCRTGSERTIDAEGLTNRYGPILDLVIDVGTVDPGDSPTVIRADAENWSLIRPGVMPERTLHQLASFVLAFVCTGNTCRSPMAEAMFNHALAERLGCQPDDLLKNGYLVLSAGLAAFPGSPASQEGVDLMAEQGMDLTDHSSQPLSQNLIRRADLICTMTRQHRQLILEEHPELVDRVRLLSSQHRDISDPIGGGMEAYRHCAAEIAESLEVLLEELVPHRA